MAAKSRAGRTIALAVLTALSLAVTGCATEEPAATQPSGGASAAAKTQDVQL